MTKHLGCNAALRALFSTALVDLRHQSAPVDQLPHERAFAPRIEAQIIFYASGEIGIQSGHALTGLSVDEPDAPANLRTALYNALASYLGDPADSDYQRGHLAALLTLYDETQQAFMDPGAIEQLRGMIAGPTPFRPMESWDRRDEPVLLLVDYSADDAEHPLENTTVAVTIGHNNDHNVGEGEGVGWQFAGWCWTHDHYVQGKGKPVGWLPLPDYRVAPVEGAPA